MEFNLIIVAVYYLFYIFHSEFNNLEKMAPGRNFTYHHLCLIGN